jgi:hypothetical protein
MDLKRFARNPQVIDSHNTSTIANNIGEARLAKEDGLLTATIRFDDEGIGDLAWKKVQKGFLRATSVAFIPWKVEEVEAGKTFKRGAFAVEGPGSVVTKSELYEISMVLVPADAGALKQALEQQQQEERTMAEEKKEAPAAPAAVPQGPAPSEKQEAPAVAAEALRPLEGLRRDVLAIAPEGLESFAAALLLQADMDLPKARQALAEEWAKRCAPVGTPEAPSAAQEPVEPAKQVIDADRLVLSAKL